MNIIDRSNYLKGLLILARKDEQLIDSEKSIIRDVAKKLGFSRDFYEDTLKGLMINKYIIEDPIRFSTKEVAEEFLSDGFKLAASDNILHDKEVKWLNLIAKTNDISQESFELLASKFKNGNNNHYDY